MPKGRTVPSNAPVERQARAMRVRPTRSTAEPTAFAGDLLELDSIAPDGTVLTSRGEAVRVLRVATANPATLGVNELARLANGFGALANLLAAGERLAFLVEASPIQLDELLARGRAHTEATATAIRRRDDLIRYATEHGIT